MVAERAYSLAWHPSKSKLLLAAGDKVSAIAAAVARGLETLAGGGGRAGYVLL